MKTKTKFETVVGWLFGMLVASAFLLGGVFICVWLWNAIYELLMY